MTNSLATAVWCAIAVAWTIFVVGVTAMLVEPSPQVITFTVSDPLPATVWPCAERQGMFLDSEGC